MQRPADLREILRYVPQYRDELFVIAIDGRIVADANFRNLLLDIAVLESLRIGVVLVHGAGHQIELLSNRLGVAASNLDGAGVTDRDTLELAITASNRVTHEILEALTVIDVRGAGCNAVVAHPAGILGGVDHQFTGRVERIDAAFLRTMLSHNVIPVVPPLGIDGEGQTYRLNSDAVAVEVAAALKAVKLIFLMPEEGIKVKQDEGGPQLIRQMTVEQAQDLLVKNRDRILPSAVSKLQHALRAAGRGIPRVHIIDGRVEEGLLAEVFSSDGIGTLIHADEYRAIRPAEKKDAYAIFSLVQIGMANDELMARTLEEIEKQIGDFFVFEIDGAIAGCIALHWYPADHKAEMACVSVHPGRENQGIGSRLMRFVEATAKQKGAPDLFCLSTQAYNYFLQKGGFQAGTPDDLPGERRTTYEQSGRRSMVLVKKL